MLFQHQDADRVRRRLQHRITTHRGGKIVWLWPPNLGFLYFHWSLTNFYRFFVVDCKHLLFQILCGSEPCITNWRKPGEFQCVWETCNSSFWLFPRSAQRRANLRRCFERLKEIVPVGSKSGRHTTLGVLNRSTILIKVSLEIVKHEWFLN